jgi:ketosteroid isomerase-like protein
LSPRPHLPYADGIDVPFAGIETMIRMFFLAFLFSTNSLIADTKSEISLALDYFGEVWSEGDLEAIRGYYHPEFVLITANGPIPLAQRLADFESVVREGKDQGALSHSELTVKELGDKHAMAFGHASLKFKDGSALDTWFTTVYVKTPFGWRAILTSNS